MASLRSIFSISKLVSLLPTLPAPKVKPKQQSIAGHRAQVAPSTSALPRSDRNTANIDLLSQRQAANTKTVIRNFAATSPDLSAAVAANLRVGIPEKYTLLARDASGKIDPEATQLAKELLIRVTNVPDYNLGFNAYGSLYEISTALGKELLIEGSAGLELALDKFRLPTRLVPFAVSKVKYYDDGETIRPVQDVGGQEVDLDLPTIFIFNLDQSLLTPYADSPLEPAIQCVLADTDFSNSLRRVMRRAIHPRLVAKILMDEVEKHLPVELANDPQKLDGYLKSLIDSVESTVNGLEPESALVGFDSVEYGYLASSSGASSDVGETLKAVQDMINAKLAAGAKVMPTILGRGAGAGTAQSIDAMLFMKQANAIRVMLNTLYSKALTLAVRLMGKDAYVEFVYDSLELRPSGELEAYKAMEQSRTLELLSIGLISDEEACVKLTGNLPPEGYTPKSGTMFKSGTPQVANPDSQTSTMRDGQKTPEDA